MQFLIALVVAALVGYLLWKVMVRPPADRSTASTAQAPARGRLAPDDDPEFLRELGERLRREGEDPQSRR